MLIKRESSDSKMQILEKSRTVPATVSLVPFFGMLITTSNTTVSVEFISITVHNGQILKQVQLLWEGL